MKKYLFLALLFLVAVSLAPAADKGYKDWKLVFSDHFRKSGLDKSKWNRIDYAQGAGADWHKKQSKDKGVISFEKADGDGAIVLWGKKGRFSNCESPQPKSDTYACGGIFTEKTFAFQYGYVEVRARFDGCRGAWPAIWLLPSGKGGIKGWPNAGEIDILEHLNHETTIYQTLHMAGDNGQGHRNAGGTAQATEQNKDDWHIYGMEWTPGQIVLSFDGKVTSTIKAGNYPSWPFDKPNNEFYLLLDQQLGGAWVGHNFEDAILTGKGAGLHVDYVKVYLHPQGTCTKAKEKKK